MLAAFKRAPARDADRIRMQLHLRRAWRWKTPIGLKPSDEIEPNPAFVRGQLYKAEGEGFEPSTSLTTRNGFRDRPERAYLQGFYASCASACASRRTSLQERAKQVPDER